MKISVNFEELQSTLVLSNTVLADKSVDEKLKNIIFMVDRDSVKLVGYSTFTFCRTELEKVEVIDLPEDGSWQFQVKATELNKIIGSFSTLSRTKVSAIEFESDDARIKVFVHEEPIEEGNERLAQVSSFKLDNPQILKNIDTAIHMNFPEESEMLTSGDLFLYLDSLFPIMTNETSSKVGNKINFAEDYAFVITPTMSAFMVNKLPEAFKDLTLTYSSANFLKRLCDSSDSLSVAKIDKYLCIQSGSTEAFMQYQPVRVNYKMYVEKKSKDLGIVVDRLYLKDVLKRMGNVLPDGKAHILEDETIHMENANFQQIIPLEKVKGEVNKIGFAFSIPVFDKAIVGRDDVFSQELFIHFVPTARGYLVYLSDKTGSWFSATQVTSA